MKDDVATVVFAVVDYTLRQIDLGASTSWKQIQHSLKHMINSARRVDRRWLKSNEIRPNGQGLHLCLTTWVDDASIRNGLWGTDDYLGKRAFEEYSGEDDSKYGNRAKNLYGFFVDALDNGWMEPLEVCWILCHLGLKVEPPTEAKKKELLPGSPDWVEVVRPLLGKYWDERGCNFRRIPSKSEFPAPPEPLGSVALNTGTLKRRSAAFAFIWLFSAIMLLIWTFAH